MAERRLPKWGATDMAATYATMKYEPNPNHLFRFELFCLSSTKNDGARKAAHGGSDRTALIYTTNS